MELTSPQPVALTALSESLRSIRLCAPVAQQSLERSLASIGQIAPLLVFSHDDKLEVIDGFKRLHAARNLGWAEISVTPLDVTMTGAKIRVWQSNIGIGLSELEEAWLVRSLHREDGLTQVQIGQLLGRHKSWVNRRLVLVEGLCGEAQQAVRLGLMSATSARGLCRLPRGNQAEVASVVTQRGLTTRQTVHLVDAVLSVRDDEIPALLGQQLAKQASGEGEQPSSKRKRTPGEWVVADAESIRRLSARLQARLLERSLASLGAEAATLCEQTLRELDATLDALRQTLKRALPQEVKDDCA